MNSQNNIPYSIVRWCPGAAGSFILSMSDILRYNKALTAENIRQIQSHQVNKLHIDGLPDRNEYTSGGFCDFDVCDKYFLVEHKLTKNGFYNTDHILKILVNSKANNLQEYHVMYHGLQNNEETILKNLMDYSGYTKHISIVGDKYKSRMLKYFKHSSISGELITTFEYICDPVVKIPSGMENYKYTYNDLFTQRSKFKEIIKLLSGKTATDEIWNFAQDYYNKNEYIIHWMENNWPDVAEIYQKQQTTT